MHHSPMQGADAQLVSLCSSKTGIVKCYLNDMQPYNLIIESLASYESASFNRYIMSDAAVS